MATDRAIAGESKVSLVGAWGAGLAVRGARSKGGVIKVAA